MTELPSVGNCDRRHTLPGHGTRRVTRVLATCDLCGQDRTVYPKYPLPVICRPCRDEHNREREEWLDDIAVERLLAGDPPAHTTRAEREAAVARLTGLGMSTTAIAARLRLTARTVTRLRARTRQMASAA